MKHKRMITAGCIMFLIVVLTGAYALAATYSAQDFSPKVSMRINDHLEGFQIDATKAVVSDDGSTIAFQVTSAKAYEQKLLAGQHIYFFLDTDQNAKTGVYSPTYTMGIDRVIEIGYIEDKGVGRLFATVHNGKRLYGTSLDVGFDGTNLVAFMPRQLLGVWGKFDWKMQIFSEKTGDYKGYDAVPNDKFATYELFVSADSFSDIKKSDWYYAHVADLIGKKIINGYSDGSFKPQQNITRAEFCKTILAVLRRNPSLTTTSTFNDAKTHWAKGYIETAKDLGIVNGYVDGDFRPNSYITRAEISKMITLSVKLDTTEAASGFSDCSGNWAERYISALKTTSVIAGYQDGTFRPQNFATRAEVCKMVDGLIKPVN